VVARLGGRVNTAIGGRKQGAELCDKQTKTSKVENKGRDRPKAVRPVRTWTRPEPGILKQEVVEDDEVVDVEESERRAVVAEESPRITIVE
jgi:hypothetical protein